MKYGCVKVTPIVCLPTQNERNKKYTLQANNDCTISAIIGVIGVISPRQPCCSQNKQAAEKADRRCERRGAAFEPDHPMKKNQRETIRHLNNTKAVISYPSSLKSDPGLCRIPFALLIMYSQGSSFRVFMSDAQLGPSSKLGFNQTWT